jgi:hypothetical protein
VLEVYETEDASLLCTAQRLWGLRPAWRVCDADEHPVGSLWCSGGRPTRWLLADRWGQCLARIEPSPNGTLGQFIAPAGDLLGTLECSPQGDLLTFAPVLDANPFARMIVLAAGLQF